MMLAGADESNGRAETRVCTVKLQEQLLGTIVSHHRVVGSPQDWF